MIHSITHIFSLSPSYLLTTYQPSLIHSISLLPPPSPSSLPSQALAGKGGASVLGKVEKEKDRLVVSCRLLRSSPSGTTGTTGGGGSGNGGGIASGGGASGGGGGHVISDGVSKREDEDDSDKTTTTTTAAEEDGSAAISSSATGGSTGSGGPTTASTSTGPSTGGVGGLGLADVEVWTIFDGAHEALALRPASQLPGDKARVSPLPCTNNISTL